MNIFGKSYKGNIVFDATTGAPTGVSGVESATVLDGVIGAATGLLNGGSTFTTGSAKTVGEIAKLVAAAAGATKFSTGSWIPRKA